MAGVHILWARFPYQSLFWLLRPLLLLFENDGMKCRCVLKVQPATNSNLSFSHCVSSWHWPGCWPMYQIVVVGQCFCISKLAARISSIVAASVEASEELVALGHPLCGGRPNINGATHTHTHTRTHARTRAHTHTCSGIGTLSFSCLLSFAMPNCAAATRTHPLCTGKRLRTQWAWRAPASPSSPPR